MKTLKNLIVEVSYVVALTNIKVPDKVAEQLEDFEEFNITASTADIDEDNSEIMDWVADNIKESDCSGWDFEVLKVVS